MSWWGIPSISAPNSKRGKRFRNLPLNGWQNSGKTNSNPCEKKGSGNWLPKATNHKICDFAKATKLRGNANENSRKIRPNVHFFFVIAFSVNAGYFCSKIFNRKENKLWVTLSLLMDCRALRRFL